MAKGGGKAKFQQDTTVYARNDGLMYKAKILKVEQTEEGHHYFLHYLGWNQRWDRWSPESELSPDTPESETLAKQLKADLKTNDGKKRKSTGGDDAGAEGGASEQKKAKKPPLRTGTEDDSSETSAVKLPLPLTLKKQLVDEWERITQEPKRLVPLPREYTAGDAIDAFLDSKKQRFNSAQMARFRELCDALKLYFDKALPLLLLYQQEQPQYAALQKKHPGKSPCELYGVEHLLRLFVKLPSLLAQTAMTAVEITQVQAKLGDFLKFVQKQSTEMLISEYEPAADVMQQLTAE